jgi:hypothetical protein
MTMQCSLKGDYVGNSQSEGRQVRVNLKEILYAPGLNFNLLSVTQCLKYLGVTFGGDSQGLGLSFEGKQYRFDKELIHGNGNCMQQISKQSSKKHPMKQVSSEASNLAMTFDKFHSIMGHPNNAVLKETAKAFNIQLTDVHHRPCQLCVKAKIRMKIIPKENDNIATKKGERLLIDISWIRKAIYADNRYWLSVMDVYKFLMVFLYED